jgi:hypothetical protein
VKWSNQQKGNSFFKHKTYKMSLTGYPLAINSAENIACYGAGNPATIGFDLAIVRCPQDGAVDLSLDWALPCTENGITVAGFNYQKAVNATKPRADAVKVLTVIDYTRAGEYKRFFVTDAYTLSDYNTACCAGCTPLPAVTIPAPILGWTECVLPTPPANPCVYFGSLYVAPLTGTNDTWTVTPTGKDAAGNAIVFAPTTSASTTLAGLVAAMNTNWASELGSGTFTLNGNNINYSSTNGATLGFTVVQSDV